MTYPADPAVLAKMQVASMRRLADFVEQKGHRIATLEFVVIEGPMPKKP